jgi:hypothetical protein
MRNLLRKPLSWMVLGECAVVTALVMLAWHLVAGAGAPELPSLPDASPPAQASHVAQPVSVDANPQVKTPERRLLPGLNIDANIWRSRLAELNHGEAAFELLEWRLVRSAMDAAHRYVESVVLPSVAHAERRGG